MSRFACDRFGYLALLAVLAVLALSFGCRSEAPPPPAEAPPEAKAERSSLTVGEIAAGFVVSLADVVDAEGLGERLEKAAVVDNAAALELLAAWSPEDPIKQARAALGSEETVAVEVPGEFLYVAPTGAKAGIGPVGIDVTATPDGESRCPHFHRSGEDTDFLCGCYCRVTIQSGPCPTTSTGSCSPCPRQGCDLGSVFEDPWVDPVSPVFARVRELLGEDPRFACATEAEALKPGARLMEGCGPATP